MSTPGNYVACAFCERHLLRGEQPEVFLNDGERREVCELCVPQALYAGWIRVGVNDAPTLAPNRKRGAWSFLDRFRKRGGPGRAEPEAAPERPAGRHRPVPKATPVAVDPEPVARRSEWRPHRIEDEVASLALAEKQQGAPLAAYTTTATGDPAQVTTAGARMAARAVDLYNHSEHPRKLSGIGRSLGAPWVTIRTLEGSRIQLVIAWELSWYRFELDLARESDGVRATGQGTSLQELETGDVDPNAVADENGYLYLRIAGTPTS